MGLTPLPILTFWILVMSLTVFGIIGSPVHDKSRRFDHFLATQTSESSVNALEPERLLALRSSELEARNHGMSIVKATHLRAIIPTEIAAQSLVFFYRKLWVRATEIWIHEQPADTLRVYAGNLLLSFASDAPIPWEFVIRFANKMMGATALGFAGTYDIEYFDPITDQSALVSLRVMDHIASLKLRSSSTSLLANFSSASGTMEPRPSNSTSESHVQVSSSFTKPAIAARHPGPDIKGRTLNKLMLQKFRALALITPVPYAVQLLEDFYDIIAMKVETGVWANEPPRHNFMFKRWNCELSFFCYAAPIRWDFVQEVALDMAEWARKGFTPSYEMVYKAVDDIGQEIFVTVVMKLSGKGGHMVEQPLS